MDEPRSQDLSQQKKALRNDLRRARATYCELRGASLDQDFTRLAGHAGALLDWVQSRLPSSGTSSSHAIQQPLIIASFKAKGREIDPGALELALRARGHKLAWPRVLPDGLRFFADDGVPPFAPGSYGLLEPHPRATELEPDVILLPLIGFDDHGNRLGQGGGYYDRALGRRRGKVLSVGLAFDCQRVAALPVEAHDLAMQAVLTPAGLRVF